MQTGAHPDDETSHLLAKLSLGEGYHVSYVNAVSRAARTALVLKEMTI